MRIAPQSKRYRETTPWSHRQRLPNGFTITELVVAASLLVVVMSVITTLSVRGGRLRQDARHYRLAMDELSNQLDWLTALDDTSLAKAMDNLSPSTQIRGVLSNPILSAELLSDELGTRISMTLRWNRLGKNKPVTLVGWVDSLPPTATSASGGVKP